MSEYKYPFFDDKGKVNCQLCGKSYLVISPKHLFSHKMKYERYKEKFPDAPLANTEFAKRGLYGKNKELFYRPEIEDDLKLDPNLIVDFEDEEPEIEDLDIKEIYAKEEKSLNPIEKMKGNILDYLRLYSASVQQDYLIRQFRGGDNNLDFEFTTDFCDPVLKIVFDFPDTFWHNMDAAPDLNRDYKLESYGWRILKFKSNAPSDKDIEKVLNSL